MPQKDLTKLKVNLKLGERLGVSSAQVVNSANKTSNISVNEVLTSSNYLAVINCESSASSSSSSTSSPDVLDDGSSCTRIGNVYVIDDVANYQSPLKMFRGYRLIEFLLFLKKPSNLGYCPGSKKNS
jgi:hypothetical protein